MFPGLTELLLIGCFVRVNLDPKIQNNYIYSKNQLADILTKGNFTSDECESFVVLIHYQPFQFCSLLCDGEAISTRFRKSWDENHLNVDQLMHDIWVVYFKT